MNKKNLSCWNLKIAILLSFFFLLILPSHISAQIDFGNSDIFEDELSIDISLYSSKSSFSPGEVYDFAIITDIDEPWHINSATPHEEWLIATELKIDTTTGFTTHSITYPSGYNIDFSGTPMSVYGDSTIIYFQIYIDENLSEGDYSIPVHFTYQPCNDKECRAPQTIDRVLKISVGEEGNDIHRSIFTNTAQDIESNDAKTSDETHENEIQRLIDKYGFWGYIIALGLAFLTGLLLSFSPCTYPMIPITVSIFAGQKRSLGRGFLMSLIYVGSMAFVYGIMGLA